MQRRTSSSARLVARRHACRRLCTAVPTTVRHGAPRYAGVSTFFRAPHVDLHGPPAALAEVDIGLLGVPFDGGASNRPGARYGPREVRSQSVSHIRRVNQATGVKPFEMGFSIADVGDAHVSRPYEL
eukprot:5498277-Prymnesium_polylepis.1